MIFFCSLITVREKLLLYEFPEFSLIWCAEEELFIKRDNLQLEVYNKAKGHRIYCKLNSYIKPPEKISVLRRHAWCSEYPHGGIYGVI